MSLAFLPVCLFAAVASSIKPLMTRAGVEAGHSPALPSFPQQPVRETFANVLTSSTMLVMPALQCIVAALIGFAIPMLLLGWFARVNLLTVWWLNYQNHAEFYRHYPRTYWKWLLVNPVELSFAAGWPIALLAAVGVWQLCRTNKSPLASVAWSALLVGGSLWLTGKNSGEAARLWIVLLPWLVWFAGPLLAREEAETKSRWWRPAWIVVAVQLLVCLLTVSRVSGFHFEIQ
jgi:methylthioxylose transferase